MPRSVVAHRSPTARRWHDLDVFGLLGCRIADLRDQAAAVRTRKAARPPHRNWSPTSLAGSPRRKSGNPLTGTGAGARGRGKKLDRPGWESAFADSATSSRSGNANPLWIGGLVVHRFQSAASDRPLHRSSPAAGPAAARSTAPWRDRHQGRAGPLAGPGAATATRRISPASTATCTGAGISGELAPPLPIYLTAEAVELIEGQYADRPQLRPILDAVLALLPRSARRRYRPAGLSCPWSARAGPSPWCGRPRRTGWTWACASTMPSRVAGCESAKGIGGGGATVRIALRRPEDIDEEVRGLMRRAYQENAALPRRGVGPGGRVPWPGR